MAWHVHRAQCTGIGFCQHVALGEGVARSWQQSHHWHCAGKAEEQWTKVNWVQVNLLSKLKH